MTRPCYPGRALTAVAAGLLLSCPVVADSPRLPLVEGTRTVLAGIVQAAQDNARKSRRFRVDGDELTSLYIRAAAAAAQQLPKEKAAGAFLLGLGLGLDESNILRHNPLTYRLCRQIESDTERQTRLHVLGKPTMRQRHDWTQHFVVSCALTEIVGAPLAEAAGVLKEQLDARPGGSGFSFGDLNADLAGVAFASRLKKADISLKTLASDFTVTAYLPDARGLQEDLSAARFARDYGSLDDPRYKAEVSRIRKQIEVLPGYQK